MGSGRKSTSSASGASGERSKDQTRLRIEKMEAEREERRRAMQERKLERAEEEQRNIAAGNPGDVDFIGLVRRWRAEHGDTALPHDFSLEHPKICICVRKRPVSDKERKKRDHDSITCLHPTVWVHSAKLRVDGITKYLDHNSFRFDHAFDEISETSDVYNYSTKPLVEFVCDKRGGRATVFAYGQTGSGKTYTMGGIQTMIAEDLYGILNADTLEEDDEECTSLNTYVTLSIFEIYGGYIQDLLNDRRRLKLLEDGKGEVVVSGLEEFEAEDPAAFLSLIDAGNRKRTTHATEANDSSSRSHAICQILLRDRNTCRLRGKLSLVDLAGSERGTDTKSHNRQRRTESSEINTSLLALKECIRALDSSRGSGRHVPYRASKLTLILKDCFTSRLARTTMIATVSPGASSADHTLNTLRYADRIKEKKVGDITNIAKVRKKQAPPREISAQSDELSPIETTVDELPFEEDGSLDDEDLYEHTATAETDGETNVENLDENDEAVHNETDLLAEEGRLLSLHMSFIQENAELLTEEGRLLRTMQGEDVPDDTIHNYANTLLEILDRKTQMIEVLQETMVNFQAKALHHNKCRTDTDFLDHE